MLCRHNPFAISICKPRNRNHANAVLVVATVSRAEADAPPRLPHVSTRLAKHSLSSSHLACFGQSRRVSYLIHALLGRNGIGARHHLDKSVALLMGDDARLHPAKALEYVANLTLRPASTTYEQCATENANVKAAGDRPPVLMCMDNVAHVMLDSKYQILNEAGKLTSVHSHDLALVKHFHDLLSGAASLPNGGTVLAATSASDAPKSEAMDVGIAVAETRQDPEMRADQISL